MNKKKGIKRALCLLLILCLLTPFPAAYAQASGEQACLEDGRVLRSVECVLYYLSEDASQLVPVVRRLTLLPEETLPEVLVSALAKEEDGLVSPYPANAGIHLRFVEKTADIATVCFDGDFSSLTARELFSLKAAVVNTLTETGDIAYVNLLFNGMELSVGRQEGIPLPTGALERFEQDLSGAWAKEQSQSMQSRPASFTRKATLYFVSEDGRYLIPEVRSITFTGEDYIAPLLAELSRGPKSGNALRRGLPSSLMLLDAPFYDFLQDGGRYVDVNLNYAMSSFLRQFSSMRQQILGSLVCTLTTFVPGLAGVHIRLNRRYMEQEDSAYQQERVYIRSQFEGLVGSSVQLYLPKRDGRLLSIRRDVQRNEAGLRDLLEQLLLGPGESEEADLFSPFPDGFDSGCVSGLFVVSDTLVFNLGQDGAALLSSLSPEQECGLVYSIVNTYTSLPGVRRVQFLCDGYTIDSLAGRINLREPLLRNPSLIQKTLY